MGNYIAGNMALYCDLLYLQLELNCFFIQNLGLWIRKKCYQCRKFDEKENKMDQYCLRNFL